MALYSLTVLTYR